MSEEELRKHEEANEMYRIKRDMQRCGGEETLLKRYTNKKAQEKEEEDRLNKFVIDSSLQLQNTSLTGSKSHSKSKQTTGSKTQPVLRRNNTTKPSIFTGTMLDKKKVIAEQGLLNDKAAQPGKKSSTEQYPSTNSSSKTEKANDQKVAQFFGMRKSYHGGAASSMLRLMKSNSTNPVAGNANKKGPVVFGMRQKK